MENMHTDVRVKSVKEKKNLYQGNLPRPHLCYQQNHQMFLAFTHCPPIKYYHLGLTLNLKSPVRAHRIEEDFVFFCELRPSQVVKMRHQ